MQRFFGNEEHHLPIERDLAYCIDARLYCIFYRKKNAEVCGSS